MPASISGLKQLFPQTGLRLTSHSCPPFRLRYSAIQKGGWKYIRSCVSSRGRGEECLTKASPPQRTPSKSATLSLVHPMCAAE